MSEFEIGGKIPAQHLEQLQQLLVDLDVHAIWGAGFRCQNTEEAFAEAKDRSTVIVDFDQETDQKTIEKLEKFCVKHGISFNRSQTNIYVSFRSGGELIRRPLMEREPLYSAAVLDKAIELLNTGKEAKALLFLRRERAGHNPLQPLEIE